MGNQLSSAHDAIYQKQLAVVMSSSDDTPTLTETSRSSASPESKTAKHASSTSLRGCSTSTRSENTTSSLVSRDATTVKAAGLRGNLIRCQKRDPMEIYKVISIMGEGSMGCVCKVKKHSNAKGGSARPDFVKRNSSLLRNRETCCFPLLHNLLPKRESSLSFTDLDQDGASPADNSRHSLISYVHNNNSTHNSKPEPYYALKSIHLGKCKSRTFQKELRNEIAILRELDHAHIARALETYELLDERLFIVLELCSGGDLYTRDPYSEQEAATILSSILSAVSYLHSKGIVHRDLKFENIMFVDNRPDAEVKLIDFGLSQKFADDSNMTDAVGTVYTMAPELLVGSYNAKADIWSLGVIAYMLLSSSMPFYGKSRMQVMKRIMKGHVKFTGKRWIEVSKYGKAMVRHLLKFNAIERPSADRAFKFTRAWMQNLQPETNSPSPTTTMDTRQLRWKQQRSNLGSSSWEEEAEMMDRIQVSIQAFAQYNTLKKLALLVIAHKSTASEIGWLRSTFNRFDLLQNGEISLEEFTEALSDVYDYSKEEMEALFLGMDVDGTGMVHYTEFLAATIEAHGSIEEHRIADAFDRIDCDDSGFITIQNLRDFLGDDVPHSYLETIIDDADLKRDKRISYEEFLELWYSAGDGALCSLRRKVVDRRMKREGSLSYSFSDLSASDDRTDEDESEEPAKEPTLTDNHQPDHVLKAPVIHDTRIPACSNAVDCFSQRKAMSLRAGWM